IRAHRLDVPFATDQLMSDEMLLTAKGNLLRDLGSGELKIAKLQDGVGFHLFPEIERPPEGGL
ncbi:hypothetical protein, partial [Staphylococcus aureus]